MDGGIGWIMQLWTIWTWTDGVGIRGDKTLTAWGNHKVEVIAVRPFVMSHNTPVTSLTNFQLVPGHTVTSICIPRFPKLMLHSNLDAHPVTPSTFMSHHLQLFQIMEVLHP